MLFAMELWKPILLGGLAVFVMSALVWTLLPHHRTEWAKLMNEDAVGEALRGASPAPGLYAIPHMGGMSGAGTTEEKAKLIRGPIAYITILRNGAPAMGPMMVKSALSSIVIAFFIAYVGWHTLPPGTEYLKVFRVVGTMGFMTYALGSMSESIWFGRPWSSFALQALDALMYGLILGGVFGWLWM